MSSSTWRTSSHSGEHGNCVEVAIDRRVQVRDTKDRDGGRLALSRRAWSAAVTALVVR